MVKAEEVEGTSVLPKIVAEELKYWDDIEIGAIQGLTSAIRHELSQLPNDAARQRVWGYIGAKFNPEMYPRHYIARTSIVEKGIQDGAE